MLKLYDNIKTRRLELGLSQEELAIKVGYSGKSMIAHIEKGDVDLTQSKIVAIAKALSIPPGDLMGWTDESTNDPEPDTAMSGSAEDHLIKIYRNLNGEGQEKLIDYADDLAASGRYKKHGSVQMDEIKGA